MSGDLFHLHSGGALHLVGLEARDTAKHPAVHRITPTPANKKVIWLKMSAVIRLKKTAIHHLSSLVVQHCFGLLNIIEH